MLTKMRRSFELFACVALLFIIACQPKKARRNNAEGNDSNNELLRVDVFYDSDSCPWTTDRLYSCNVREYVYKYRVVSTIDALSYDTIQIDTNHNHHITIQDPADVYHIQKILELSEMSDYKLKSQYVDCWFGVLITYKDRVDTIALNLYPEMLFQVNNGPLFYNPKILPMFLQYIYDKDPEWRILVESHCPSALNLFLNDVP